MKQPTAPSIVLTLTPEEALVLFEWISRFNRCPSGDLEDPAEQRVLWDIEAMLEKTLVEPLQENYAEQLARARGAVRGDDTPP